MCLGVSNQRTQIHEAPTCKHKQTHPKPDNRLLAAENKWAIQKTMGPCCAEVRQAVLPPINMDHPQANERVKARGFEHLDDGSVPGMTAIQESFNRQPPLVLSCE